MLDIPHFTFLQAKRRVLNPKFACLLDTILVVHASHTEISSNGLVSKVLSFYSISVIGMGCTTGFRQGRERTYNEL
jgi:hypothetical protein